jgi:hypothetical protein
MGVSIGISGAVRSEQVRRDLLRWAGAAARELDWSSRPVALSFKKARLRSGSSSAWLEMAEARGVSLLPHFACEQLPLVFVDGDGTLVEEMVEASGGDAPTLLGGAIVKTQFSGPAVHREICEFLGALRQSFAPDLAIDDETGFFESRDEAALNRTFAESWDAIARGVQPDLRPGARLLVGGFRVEVPEKPVGDELSALSKDERALLVSADRACINKLSGFGTTLDHSRASVSDLELAISDVDEPGYVKDADSPEVVALAAEAGAYFGRTLVALLGGAWVTEEGRPVVVDIGRSGLVVDPFQVARDRILQGPPFGFVNHLEVYETLVKHLAQARPS